MRGRVLILYNEPVLPVDHPDHESEHEVVDTVREVCATLTEAGYAVDRLGLGAAPAVLLTRLRAQGPEVVFNLFEGTAGHEETEVHVAGLLEWLRIPFTGSPASALSLARNKHLAKQLFRGAGLPTPDFLVVDDAPVRGCTLDWPLIVKPALQDASVGIDQRSVVTTPQQLNDRVAYLLERYGPPVLVERFLRGRELNVALIEDPDLRTLPPSEVLFIDQDPAFWPLITYDSKWKPGSRDDRANPIRYPAEISADLADRLAVLARRAYRLVGCRDYARVDFRLDATGQPSILEVNPNPDFSASAGLALALASAGTTHARFTVDLVERVRVRALRASRVPWAPRERPENT